MDQNYNNSQNEFLWTLLAHPADDAQQYNYNLQRLVNDFPQSGILQALLAHTSDEKNLKQASVYFNAKALYKLINAPASLIGVAEEKIILQNGSRPLNYNGYQQHDTNTGNAENYFSDHTVAAVETLTAADELPATEHGIIQTVVDEHHVAETTADDLLIAAENNAEHVDTQDSNIISDEHYLNQDIAEVAHDSSTAVPEGGEGAESTHEALVADTIATGIKDEVAQEVPLAEPIINYAAGMGHRLPPDTNGEEQVSPTPEAHTPPPIPEEHLVVDEAGEEHLPPPIPEDHWPVDDAAPEVHTTPLISEDHWPVDAATTEAHMPPPVAEEHWAVDTATPEAHTPPPVPEEHWAVDVAAPEAHTPPAVPEEHWAVDAAAPEANAPPPVAEEHSADPVAAEYNGFEEPQPETHADEYQQHHEERPAAEPVTEEPVQQYRPWDEPAPIEEHHQPEVKEEPTPEQIHQPEVKLEEVSHTIDDEVYDEIGSVEPGIIGNIAATNYFMFDRAFGEHKKPEPVIESAAAAEPVNESEADAEQQDVSKYHDEKMPYSFLWWLDKTRKEHSGVYQPYTAPEETSTAGTRARLKASTDELQQQYYENIFHITSVEELDKSLPQPPFAAPPPFEHKKKEQVIIERFIQEEPQIRPQSSDKLDNENKAKKSSEDRDELVSETLAAIYSDQMLYHKAIASYKKLMLRFPEKSRYFAAKIEQLEKKTN